MTVTAQSPLQRRGLPVLRPSLRLRLWVAASLVLLVLPLAAAAWAFGSYAAANERTRTDSRLTASLDAAVSEYARTLDDARLEAMQLAGTRSVQRALERRDRGALARLARTHRNVVLLLPGEAAPADPVRRSVDVVLGAKRVGAVVATVPLDHALMTRIARRTGIERHGAVAAVARNGRITASSARVTGPAAVAGTRPHGIDVAGRAYRAVATPIMRGTQLVVLAPTKPIESAAASIRNRILLIGLGVLGAVMLLGYLLAPEIGRARVAQHQRALAERVLGHVADGVVLVDLDGVVRFWNRAAETITGLEAARALGSRADDVVPGWQAAAQQIPVAQAGTGGGPASATVPIESGGVEVWIAASAVRFAEGTVYTFRDISEAERLDQAKADFVATVSHELRTPLSSVYGAAMTLRHQHDRLEPRQRAGLLDLLGEQAARLSGIIDDILLASRLDSGRLELEHERFDAREVTQQVVDAARVRADESISIELSVPASLPDVAGDGDMVSQVLANLVENAVKYSPGGGRVDVRVEQRDDRVRFEVHDEGLGIPLGEQERIFEKFYRLDPNHTRGIGGSGLGLYISSELVRRMDGEIDVRSALGEGSVFSFELPLAAAAESVPARR